MQAMIQHNNGIMLVASRTDTEWFHYAAKAASVVCFPRKRIRFVAWDGGGQGASPAFASALFGFGDESKKRLSKLTGIFMGVA